MKKRKSKGVLDDLYATAFAFDDGERRALILAVDVCLLSTEQSERIRKNISEVTGLDTASIFVNCSHTHTGPTIEVDLDGEPTNSEYDKTFFELLTKVAEDAFCDMRESCFSVGDGTASGISFPRRYRMKDGKVQTNPGVDNTEILTPLGTANDAVKFLKIDRENAETLVIVNFGTHADTVGGEYISGDWPNFVCKTIETVFENTKCIFLTGSQGDVNHINISPTPGERKGLDYDSSAGVVSVCGLLEMASMMDDSEPDKLIFESAAAQMLESVIDKCTGDIGVEYDGLICHVTVAKPQGMGIDRCAVYGDFFYLEALARYLVPNFKKYW